MKRFGNVVWGVVLVVLGALVALKTFDIIDFNLFFEGWWTLFIIIPSLVGIITDKDKSGSFVFFGIGVCLLLAAQNLITFGMIWKLIVSLIIIVIGFKLIFGKSRCKTKEIELKFASEGKKLKNGYALFSGAKLDFSGERFEGAELTALFGGVECFADNAIVCEDVVIKATAIFGGIDITLPSDVNIQVVSTSVFGGVSNKTKRKTLQNSPTVYIKATCMFGGVEVK